LDPWYIRAQEALELKEPVFDEQAPNPDSRVMLSQQRDALGVPQADLHWQFTELDKRSVATLVDTVNDEFQRLGLGRVTPEAWLSDASTAWPVDPTVSNHPIGGFHHMGTTRMAASPQDGVVDDNARVHGIDNLYVAGSSLFPTSGWANPVLTTLALTLRLADHLKAKLSEGHRHNK
jgi:choline dehydrogenase-like flavoprotein